MGMVAVWLMNHFHYQKSWRRKFKYLQSMTTRKWRATHLVLGCKFQSAIIFAIISQNYCSIPSGQRVLLQMMVEFLLLLLPPEIIHGDPTMFIFSSLQLHLLTSLAHRHLPRLAACKCFCVSFLLFRRISWYFDSWTGDMEIPKRLVISFMDVQESSNRTAWSLLIEIISISRRMTPSSKLGITRVRCVQV